MQPIVNDELNAYLKTVWYYFSEEQASPAALTKEETWKKEYISIWHKHQEFTAQWDHALSVLRENTAIKGIRDMSYEGSHYYKAVLELHDSGEDKLPGIIILVSFVGNFIGSYFSILNPGKGTDTRYRPIATTSGSESGCSYFPINAAQEQLLPEILQVLQSAFPGFSLFNNQYADHKIPRIQSGSGFFKEIDLFQVVFCTNIHGVI